MIKEAEYYEVLSGGRVRCTLCPADCKLTEGKTGICGCRYNQGGRLVTDNYGELVTMAVDPIEKKPLYHFYPGSDIISTGPNGCNLACVHCQNWTISQTKVPTTYVSPEDLVRAARRKGSIGVAFTYTEPLIWFEYLMDAAPLLHEEGMKVVLVSNGYINPEPLSRLLEHIDAANIDLKGMTREFYLKMCKGRIEPVLSTIRTLAVAKTHLELTNLIIPTKNDSDQDIHALVDFVASLSPMIPLHLSAYHPSYKLDISATGADTLLRAKKIADEKLRYVFVGNISLADASDSICPNCGHVLIRRTGYSTSVVGVSRGRCADCGFDTGIVQ